MRLEREHKIGVQILKTGSAMHYEQRVLLLKYNDSDKRPITID